MEALSPIARQFVLHWGEMSGHWGISRTMAQIHALLYLSSEPLNAEQISGALSVARSNVSTSLRELKAWGVVRVVHRLGDRRDHFETVQDAWEMFRVILDERKKREIDPKLQALHECVEESKGRKADEQHVRERMLELLDFFEMMDSWYEQMTSLPTSKLKRFVKLGKKVRGLM